MSILGQVYIMETLHIVTAYLMLAYQVGRAFPDKISCTELILGAYLFAKISMEGWHIFAAERPPRRF